MEPTNDIRTRTGSVNCGYALSFVPKSGLFGPPAAYAVLAGLRHMAFSGRCEYYTWESPRGDDYVVSLALTNRTGNAEPTYEWWKQFAKAVAEDCKSGVDITLDIHSSELASVEGMRRNCLPCGVVRFVRGTPRTTLEESESWFVAECIEIMSKRDLPQ